MVWTNQTISLSRSLVVTNILYSTAKKREEVEPMISTCCVPSDLCRWVGGVSDDDIIMLRRSSDGSTSTRSFTNVLAVQNTEFGKSVTYL